MWWVIAGFRFLHCSGSQLSCRVWPRKDRYPVGCQRSREHSPVISLESFLCLILPCFLGEMTLNSESVNLDFNLESGNVLFWIEPPIFEVVKRDDWLCRIFYLRKLYITFFWNVVGGMEFLYQRNESNFPRKPVDSVGVPLSLSVTWREM